MVRLRHEPLQTRDAHRQRMGRQQRQSQAQEQYESNAKEQTFPKDPLIPHFWFAVIVNFKLVNGLSLIHI